MKQHSIGRRPAMVLAAVLVLVALASSTRALAHSVTISKASTCSGWRIDGHNHADTIYGSSVCENTPDFFRGLYGDDRLIGNHAGDELWGGHGADEVWGGPGADLIYGNEEPDELYGGPDNDTIYGGPGNDRIDCGLGAADEAYGGGGDDTFVNCDGNAHE